jgi:methylmalonyl-CoA mutase N-terminal domain/subunit
VDPLGGSYYLEGLTNELERQAYQYFERIEELGGVVAAIEQNFFQREIAEASFRYQREVEQEQRIIVGVNRYQLEDEPQPELHKVDAALETQQIERVQQLRAQRNPEQAQTALAQLKSAASQDTNLMPILIQAAQAHVTMGEICDTLRDTWGTWRETPVF